MKNPFRFIKRALHLGSAAKTVLHVVKEVRRIDPAPISGAEKKADVLERVAAASPEIRAAVSLWIDAYVALRKAWAALKVAMAAWQQPS